MSVPTWLEDLNPRQREAVCHGSGPLLVLAGAGSGKTRVITYRIAHLIRQGMDPEGILAVTFTNKAAREMKGRACALDGRARASSIRTFHSFCAAFLRRFGSLLGLTPQFSIYDEDDTHRLLRALEPKLTNSEARQIVRGLALLKDRGIEPGAHDPKDIPPWASDLYPRYERALAESNAVDFGGLILGTVRILRDHPHVAARVREELPCILVDEFQDTNPSQLSLLRLLSPEGYWLTVVGDEDQCIYTFRGAHVNNILDFPASYPGTTVVKLEENYRSTGNILAAASAMIAHNQQRMGKTLWTRSGPGEKVRLIWHETDQEEARFVANYASKHPQEQIAVLYRTNAQSRLFEAELSRLRVPYRVVGGQAFFEREEVKDVVAYLRLLLNPSDRVSLRRVINKPPRGLGETSQERLFAFLDQGLGLLEAAQRAGLRGGGLRAVQEFATLLESLRIQAAAKPLTALLEELYDRSGLKAALRERDEREGTDRLGNLGELLNIAEGLHGPDALSVFLEQAALSGAADEDPEGLVGLITLHNAKGLEFHTVMIVGLEQGLLPHIDAQDVEEERRLLYVGMTRARCKLILSGAAVRQLWGAPVPRTPSEFLAELPEENLDSDLHRVDRRWFSGQRVYHEDYGSGWVVEVRAKSGHTLLMVRFDNGAMARFVAEFSSLERIADDGFAAR